MDRKKLARKIVLTLVTTSLGSAVWSNCALAEEYVDVMTIGSGNSVTIDGQKMEYSVYDTFMEDTYKVPLGDNVVYASIANGIDWFGADAIENNTININNVTLACNDLAGDIVGAQAVQNAVHNSINIKDSTLDSFLVINSAFSMGTAEDNSFNLENCDIKQFSRIVGAQADTSARNNTVSITKSTIAAESEVYGAFATGNLSGNTIIIDNSKIGEYNLLYAAQGMGAATSNTINIKDSEIGEGSGIYAALAGGCASNNSILIANSALGAGVRILAGLSNNEGTDIGSAQPYSEASGKENEFIESGSGANNNRVVLKLVSLSTEPYMYGTNDVAIYGGFSAASSKGKSSNADENNVYVEITNNATEVVGGDGGSASKNVVYYDAKGEGAAQQIIAGRASGVNLHAKDDNGGNNVANDNIAIMANGKTEIIVGGISNTEAQGNTVIFLGGETTGAVINQSATSFRASYVAGGIVNNPEGMATNNTVNLAGFIGEINNAYTGEPEEAIYIKSDKINYSEFVPEIKGKVYGGYLKSQEDVIGDVKSGNTLNVFGKVIGVENITNFANVNFYVPATAKLGETILELTGMPITSTYKEGLKRYVVEKVAEETDLTDVVLNTYIANLPELKLGESIGLISNPSGIITENTVYKIDDKPTDADKNGIVTAIKEAGVELQTLGYEVDETSVFLKLKDLALAGKYVDQAATVEQALDLNKAEGYGKIYGAYGAEGATVEINTKINLPQSILYGSNVGYKNTLNVSSMNNTFKNIAKFNSLNFYIPTEAENGSTMLSLTDTNPVNLEATNVKAGVMVGSNLNDGDSIVLLDTVGGIEGENITYGNIKEGIATEYLTEISKDGNKLQAKIGKKIVGESAKSPVETIAANVAILNAGQDMIAGAGMANAQAVAGGNTMIPFAAVGGSNMKYKTGSHVDVKGWNMNLGVAKEIANSAGKLLLAPVVEYGRGNYDSYLDNSLHGSGNSHFWGVGLMAKQTNTSGLYYEASARGGKMSSDYKMENGSNKGANYDTSAVYVAAHLGVGKEIKLGSKDSLDTYAKYFFTHQQGDTVNIKTALGNDKYHFDSVNSQRTRLGARLNHKLSEKSSLYTGLAWQYEFDGEARAVTRSGATPAPTLKGHSGIAELGMKLEPVAAKYALDLGVTGSAGKQKGVGVNVQFNWKF